MNRVICFIVFFLCFVQSILAYLVSEFSIEQFVKSSDLICVCQVQRVVIVIPESDKQGYFEAECKVLSTFKGQSVKSVMISIFIDSRVNPDSLGFGCLRKGDVAILFLKGSKQATLEFAIKHHPKIPLVQFYEKYDVSTNSVQKRISTQLMAALESDNTAEVINGLHWLTEMNEDIPQDKLLQFSKSKNKDLRVVALQRLISYKNTTVIRDVALLLLSPDIHKEISQSQLAELAWTLESEASSVDLDLANRLAASSNDIVQRIGVRILREVGDNSSIPYLMLALDAENKDTKRSAVVALTRITGKKVSGSSWHEFMKNPSAETQKWKIWWQEKNSTKNVPNKSAVTNSIKPNVSR